MSSDSHRVDGAAGQREFVLTFGRVCWFWLSSRFAGLLQRADLETARRVAERLRLAVEKLGIAHAASPLGYVTIS
jgi:hypothetical protein